MQNTCAFRFIGLARRTFRPLRAYCCQRSSVFVRLLSPLHAAHLLRSELVNNTVRYIVCQTLTGTGTWNKVDLSKQVVAAAMIQDKVHLSELSPRQQLGRCELWDQLGAFLE